MFRKMRVYGLEFRAVERLTRVPARILRIDLAIHLVGKFLCALDSRFHGMKGISYRV